MTFLIKKMAFYFKSLILHTYFWLKNRLSKAHLVLASKSEYSISLTTYGKRIETVYLTIESLSNQLVPPSSITLWLCESDLIERTLPCTLERLRERGLTINFVQEDIRSYKKLYYEYVARKETTRSILTVDDDVFYPNWLGEKAINQARKSSFKSVICFRGYLTSFLADGSLDKYSNWKQLSESSPSIGFGVFPTGVSGILYPISSLQGLDEQKDSFLSLSPFADDIWFKCLTCSNGYKSEFIFTGYSHFYTVISGAMKGLEKINVLAGENDKQLTKSLTYFNMTPKDFL